MRFDYDNPLTCGDTLWRVSYTLDSDFAKKVSTVHYRFQLHPGEQLWSSAAIDEPKLNCAALVAERNKK